jgi:hypothetical protein
MPEKRKGQFYQVGLIIDDLMINQDLTGLFFD